jgi:hypothetical protein
MPVLALQVEGTGGLMQTWITVTDSQRMAQRLGPFSDETFFIGSDSSRCIIQVSGSGILKSHVKITAKKGSWSVGPGESGAALFLKEGPNRVRRLSTETTLRVGEQLALGSTSGPVISLDAGSSAPPPDPSRATNPGGGIGAGNAGNPLPPPSPPSSRNRLPGAGEIGDEVRRRMEAEAMRQGSVQDAARFWHRFQSGTLFRPDVIVGAAIAFFTALCGLCGGGGTGIWYLIEKFFN